MDWNVKKCDKTFHNCESIIDHEKVYKRWYSLLWPKKMFFTINKIFCFFFSELKSHFLPTKMMSTEVEIFSLLLQQAVKLQKLGEWASPCVWGQMESTTVLYSKRNVQCKSHTKIKKMQNWKFQHFKKWQHKPWVFSVITVILKFAPQRKFVKSSSLDCVFLKKIRRLMSIPLWFTCVTMRFAPIPCGKVVFIQCEILCTFWCHMTNMKISKHTCACVSLTLSISVGCWICSLHCSWWCSSLIPFAWWHTPTDWHTVIAHPFPCSIGFCSTMSGMCLVLSLFLGLVLFHIHQMHCWKDIGKSDSGQCCLSWVQMSDDFVLFLWEAWLRSILVQMGCIWCWQNNILLFCSNINYNLWYEEVSNFCNHLNCKANCSSGNLPFEHCNFQCSKEVNLSTMNCMHQAWMWPLFQNLELENKCFLPILIGHVFWSHQKLSIWKLWWAWTMLDFWKVEFKSKHWIWLLAADFLPMSVKSWRIFSHFGILAFLHVKKLELHKTSSWSCVHSRLVGNWQNALLWFLDFCFCTCCVIMMPFGINWWVTRLWSWRQQKHHCNCKGNRRIPPATKKKFIKFCEEGWPLRKWCESGEALFEIHGSVFELHMGFLIHFNRHVRFCHTHCGTYMLSACLFLCLSVPFGARIRCVDFFDCVSLSVRSQSGTLPYEPNCWALYCDKAFTA